MKQLDKLGNVKCARCGEVTNLSEYDLDEQGKLIVVCLKCWMKKYRNG